MLRDVREDPAHRADLTAALGRPRVPVLRIEGPDGSTWLPESDAIVDWLHQRAGVEPGSGPARAGVRSWLGLAARRSVVRRSLRVAAVVGTLLVVLNYGDRALAGTLGPADRVKMALTYLVPYGVATYAAVQEIRTSR